MNSVLQNRDMTSNLYKIEYANGFIQYMTLISQGEYNTVLRPAMIEIDRLEANNEPEAAALLQAQMKERFGEYFFTDGSPLYHAIHSGILSLPKHQGGDNPCKVTLVNSVNKCPPKDTD